MSDQLDKKSAKRAERLQQKASRQAQKDRMKAARIAEKQEIKLDKRAEKSRRTADKAAGRKVAPSTGQRIAVSGGRMVIGLTGVAATVVVLGGVALVTWPSWGVAAPVAVVDPAAASQQRVCPGPFLTVGANVSQANAITALGGVDVVSTGGTASPLTTTDVASNPYGPPQVFTAPADAAALAASQSQNLALETVAGLTAAACAEPVTEAWLVGGGAALGQTGVVVVSNPSDVTADVRLELYGADGPIAAEGLGGISIEPGGQVQFPLLGFAPNEPHPVIHVISAGGRITAALDSSTIFGLTPIGAEVIGPSALPSENAVIPGVVVDASNLSAEFGDGADGMPTVRLLAPADNTAVTITARTDSSTTPVLFTADLEAGKVLDLPLAGLPAGSYTLSVAATHPIVAAAQTALAAPEGTDYAWFASANPLTDTTGLAVPNGATTTLHLVNPSTEAVTVTLASGQQFAVPASGSTSLPLPGGATSLTGTNGLFASLSLVNPGRIASMVVPGGPVGANAVQVYTR